GFVVCGGIELPDPDQPALLPPTEEWHGEGIAFELLDRPALLGREPGLAPSIERGVWLPDIAQVRNPWHLRALQAGCLSRGVTLLPGWPAERLVTAGRRVLAVEGPRGRLSAARVLIASGAWSEDLLRQAGWTPGIKPIRGQIALLNLGRTGVH